MKLQFQLRFEYFFSNNDRMRFVLIWYVFLIEYKIEEDIFVLNLNLNHLNKDWKKIDIQISKENMIKINTFPVFGLYVFARGVKILEQKIKSICQQLFEALYSMAKNDWLLNRKKLLSFFFVLGYWHVFFSREERFGVWDNVRFWWLNGIIEMATDNHMPNVSEVSCLYAKFSRRMRSAP